MFRMFRVPPDFFVTTFKLSVVRDRFPQKISSKSRRETTVRISFLCYCSLQYVGLLLPANANPKKGACHTPRRTVGRLMVLPCMLRELDITETRETEIVSPFPLGGTLLSSRLEMTSPRATTRLTDSIRSSLKKLVTYIVSRDSLFVYNAVCMQEQLSQNRFYHTLYWKRNTDDTNGT